MNHEINFIKNTRNACLNENERNNVGIFFNYSWNEHTCYDLLLSNLDVYIFQKIQFLSVFHFFFAKVKTEEIGGKFIVRDLN